MGIGPETRWVHNCHTAMKNIGDNAPLKELDDWDDFVATRYRQGKSEEEFRNYKADANSTVTEFYRQNHAHQTF
jgi:inositol oxygenase